MSGTLIYKKQIISGAPEVHDEVKAADMRPVTSNAVNEKLNQFKVKNISRLVTAYEKTQGSGSQNFTFEDTRQGYIPISINVYHSMSLEVMMDAEGIDYFENSFRVSGFTNGACVVSCKVVWLKIE